MEANFFRFLAAELGTLLSGRRIDKIFNPAPGVWTLAIQNKGTPLFMLFRPAKSAGHLFVSTTKPVNPQQVPAMAMWFRKRLRNRKILGWHVDWPSLRLALELTPRDTPPCGGYLILDCRTGMTLTDSLEESFGQEPEWPALEDVLEDPDIWREHPHISPPLRAALSSLPFDEAHRFYFTVASGTGKAFYLAKKNKIPQPPLAWEIGDAETFTSALDAANAYGERTLFPLMEMEEERPENTRLKRARKRIRRNMARLDEEQERLEGLAREKIRGEALQAALYRLKEAEGLESVEVDHPEHGPMTVPLNPHLTVTENMEKYFRLAAKAQRGFPHIERRRAELRREMEDLEAGRMDDPGPASKRAPTDDGPPPLPKRYKGLAISLFRSSDGFTIIRGKNKQANHDILGKAASPFDYWFHVADGPSSHIILKRDHPGQEVPETTLAEAAILCGLKSFRKDDGKADVMYALVKDVRKVKGFAPGQVMVDKKLGTLRVDLDPALEKKLA
jgi:predicted ribosome quality control (RQC) complex YloA/Tae2 family protein